MANFNSTQDINIWNDDGSKAVTVDELSTSALGLSTGPLGYYTTAAPVLSDGQVHPLRVSASGTLLVDATLTSEEVNLRDLEYARDSVSVWSASGTSPLPTYLDRIDVDNRTQGMIGLNVIPGGIVADWGNLQPVVIGEVSPLLVTPSGRLLVETYPSPTASGVAQKSIITDADGNDADVTTAGALRVTFAGGEDSIARMIGIRYNEIFPLEQVSIWENIRQYTVPLGYTLEIIEFSCLADNSTSSARVSTSLNLGYYDMATDVYTDGGSYEDPYFGSDIELEIQATTAGSCVVTVTYTNTEGTTGRTATVTIPTASIVGQAFTCTLEGDDLGAVDVTNVTTVGGTAGVFHVHGVVTVFSERMTVSGQTFHQITSREAVIIAEGETIDIGVSSTQKAGVLRYILILGQLRSIIA